MSKIFDKEDLHRCYSESHLIYRPVKVAFIDTSNKGRRAILEQNAK